MELILQYFDLLLFLVLLGVGFFTGRMLELRHYRSIRQREQSLANVLAFTNRFPPNPVDRHDVRLVTGAVVISSDYFKQFVASLRNLIGGRFRSYETLLDRARREAILRMKEDAQRAGYSMIVNVKIENTSISGGRAGAMPSFELLAYGTAIRPARSA